jgi:hypothetical protein
MESMTAHQTAYCEHCGSEQTVVQTVGWQPDVCDACGNSLEDE